MRVRGTFCLVELLERYSSFQRWCQTVTGLLDVAASDVRLETSAAARLCGTARQLPVHEVTELVAGYEAGASVYELAKRFKIHRSTVSNILHKMGVVMRKQSMTEDQTDEAARLYEGGLSLAKVGGKLGFGTNTVRDALLRRGVMMRDPHWRPDH